MYKIAIIVPEDLIDVTDIAVKEAGTEITILKGSMSEGIKVAKELEQKDYDVIIARGGTEQLIIQSGIRIPTVPIPITPVDIFRTVEEARVIDEKIAIIPFINMMPAIESYEEISGQKLKKHLIKSEDEIEEKIKEIYESGIKLIIGGGVITRFAAKYDIKPIVIKTGKEAIINTIHEAQRIAIATRKQKEYGEKFKIIVEHSRNGIICIDKDGYINIFSSPIEKLLNIKKESALGRKINEVIPQLDIFNDFSCTIEESEAIKSIDGKKLMFSIIPIVVGKQVIGKIVSVQDIDSIQRMEEKIRQEAALTGHFARYNFNNIIGNSNEIQKLIQIAKEYAKVDSTILIEGETGTGKEVMVQSMHNHSGRALGPFVAVNCAALPESILESELFGYAHGAFTGADRKGKKGLFELAHKGTIFLDEISEMNPLVQGRLLRVLQEKQIMRLGDDKVVPIDVRVIAATNKNLRKLTAEGKFREDLYFRLNVLKIVLQPIRKRAEDIPEFLRCFIEDFCKLYGKKSITLENDAVEYLCKYPWPGNIRELKNCAERLVVTAKKSVISLRDVEDSFFDVDCISNNNNVEKYYETKRNINLMDKERNAIEEALEESCGNMINVANRLGISRTTLWRKIKKYNINISK